MYLGFFFFFLTNTSSRFADMWEMCEMHKSILNWNPRIHKILFSWQITRQILRAINTSIIIRF